MIKLVMFDRMYEKVTYYIKPDMSIWLYYTTTQDGVINETHSPSYYTSIEKLNKDYPINEHKLSILRKMYG